MSVIVWDGRTLAADKQATNSGLRRTTSKMRRLSDGTVLAWSGDEGVGRILAAWYEAGADTRNWPACQDKDHWTLLVIAKPDGHLRHMRADFGFLREPNAR